MSDAEFAAFTRACADMVAGHQEPIYLAMHFELWEAEVASDEC